MMLFWTHVIQPETRVPVSWQRDLFSWQCTWSQVWNNPTCLVILLYLLLCGRIKKTKMKQTPNMKKRRQWQPRFQLHLVTRTKTCHTRELGLLTYHLLLSQCLKYCRHCSSPVNDPTYCTMINSNWFSKFTACFHFPVSCHVPLCFTPVQPWCDFLWLTGLKATTKFYTCVHQFEVYIWHLICGIHHFWGKFWGIHFLLFRSALQSRNYSNQLRHEYK